MSCYYSIHLHVRVYAVYVLHLVTNRCIACIGYASLRRNLKGKFKLFLSKKIALVMDLWRSIDFSG